MTSCLTSIIIPCYNSANWVGDAIKSALDQRHAEIEVIVVNDGSTDNSLDVIKGFDDPRLLLINQENRGLCGARNAGLEVARGDFINFLDADDRIHPEKTKNQQRLLMANEHLAMVVGGWNLTNSSWEIYRTGYVPTKRILLKDYCLTNIFPVHATLIRASFIEKLGGFDESLRAAEDWDFHLRLCMYQDDIASHREIVCDYRMMEGTMSRNVRNQTANRIQVIEKTFASNQFPQELQHLKPRALAETYYRSALDGYTAEMPEVGKEYLEKAHDLDPSIFDSRGERLLSSLVHSSRHPAVVNRQAVYESFFQHLPSFARPMKRFEKAMEFHEARIAAYARDKDKAALYTNLLKIALRFPGAFCTHYLARKQPTPESDSP